MAALELLERYTYDDYKKWEGRWELIDGAAYAMAPAPYPLHQRMVKMIAFALEEELECEECEVFISPIDWVIDRYNVVQPDVAVFCEKIDEDTPNFTKTPPLIVEVLSLSTALKDLTIKFELYEEQGVKYYFIINPKTKEYEIFELKNGKYERVCKSCEKFRFKIDGCEFELNLKELIK